MKALLFMVLFICIGVTTAHKSKHHTPTDTSTDTSSHAVELPPFVQSKSHLFSSSGSFLLKELSNFPPIDEISKSDLIVRLKNIVRDDDDDGDGELTFIGSSTFTDSQSPRMCKSNVLLIFVTISMSIIFM